MADTNAKLGQLLNGDEKRDAIHVATFPCKAAEKLNPGTKINMYGEAEAPYIAVVDPFLEKPVKKGQFFTAIMFPGTVVNLRHEWDHPNLPSTEKAVETTASKEVVVDKTVEDAKAWLLKFSENCNTTYDNVISWGDTFRNSSPTGEFTEADTPIYASATDWHSFAFCYSVVTGKRVYYRVEAAYDYDDGCRGC